MASLLLSATTTAPSSPFYGSPLLKYPSQISKNRKKKNCYKISSKAIDGHDNQNPNPTTSSKNENKSLENVDRRNVLIGLGGYSASTILSNPLALAALEKEKEKHFCRSGPVKAPDLFECGQARVTDSVDEVNCCPPQSTKIVDFTFPRPQNFMRVRPAAHLADEKYLAKFSKALKLMKELPDSDPRSFKNQANIHCAYCNGAYEQVGFPNSTLQVHYSWLFFPWHRWYLYFFERILGELIKDPYFTIPFWNWDSPNGMVIPDFYKYVPFYDMLRDSAHLPPAVVDLSFDGSKKNVRPDEQIIINLYTMYKQMVSQAKTPESFFGAAYCAGSDPEPGAGTIELIPHNSVHDWCGDPTQPNKEDMGNFYSASRDPIFMGHHANVDRMWNIWKNLGGRRKDLDDFNYLNSEFIFYNEYGQAVKVKVKDSLDTRKLGYEYQISDIPWINYKSRPLYSKLERKTKRAKMAGITIPFPEEIFPKKLDSVVRVVVKRPKKSRSKKEKEEEEEILIIEGIEWDGDTFIKFDVLINDENDDAVIGPENTEFAGSFAALPHQHKKSKKMMMSKTRLRLEMTDLLEDLEAEDDDSIVVTLVPKAGKGKVTIGGVKIEFD